MALAPKRRHVAVRRGGWGGGTGPVRDRAEDQDPPAPRVAWQVGGPGTGLLILHGDADSDDSLVCVCVCVCVCGRSAGRARAC